VCSKRKQDQIVLEPCYAQQGTNGQWMLQKRGTQVREKRL